MRKKEAQAKQRKLDKEKRKMGPTLKEIKATIINSTKRVRKQVMVTYQICTRNNRIQDRKFTGDTVTHWDKMLAQRIAAARYHGKWVSLVPK